MELVVVMVYLLTITVLEVRGDTVGVSGTVAGVFSVI